MSDKLPIKKGDIVTRPDYLKNTAALWVVNETRTSGAGQIVKVIPLNDSARAGDIRRVTSRNAWRMGEFYHLTNLQLRPEHLALLHLGRADLIPDYPLP